MYRTSKNISFADIERICKESFEINNDSLIKNYTEITDPFSIFHLDKQNHQNEMSLKKDKPKTRNNLNDFYKVKDKDPLFWHIYILEYGMEQYEFHKNKIQLKNDTIFKWINKIETQKIHTRKAFRNDKIKVDDVINDIAGSQKIEMTTFIGIIISLQLQVIITKNNVMYVYCNNKDCDSFHHFNYDKNEMKYEKVSLREMSLKYIEGKYWGKPLLSKSAYKLSDLHLYSDILNISKTENGKNKKKDILWEEIQNALK